VALGEGTQGGGQLAAAVDAELGVDPAKVVVDGTRGEVEAFADLLAGQSLRGQLSDPELEALVGEAIAATGAASPRDMGKAMGWLAPRTRGRADGRRVSEAVSRRLAGGAS